MKEKNITCKNERKMPGHISCDRGLFAVQKVMAVAENR